MAAPASPTEKIRVLFVHAEVYNDWQLENMNLHVKQVILEEPAPEFEFFDHIYEHRQVKTSADMQEEFTMLQAMVEEVRPHVILICQAWHNFPPDQYRNLQAGGAKVITVFWDTRAQMGEYELACLHYSDYTINIDSVSNHLAMRFYSDHILRKPYNATSLFLGYHLPRQLFRHEPRAKKHQVVMLGSQEGHRRQFIAHLSAALPAHGVSFETIGGLAMHDLSRRADEYVGFDDYMETIWSSEILLSSQTDLARSQFKGKVFEFLACGGFVITDRNFEYETFLPDETVAYYDGFENAVDRIVHFCEHPEERERIRRRGHEWAQARCKDAAHFWRMLLFEASRRGSLPAPQGIDRAYRELVAQGTGIRVATLNNIGRLARRILDPQ